MVLIALKWAETKRESCVDVNVVMMINKFMVFFLPFFFFFLVIYSETMLDDSSTVDDLFPDDRLMVRIEE